MDDDINIQEKQFETNLYITVAKITGSINKSINLVDSIIATGLIETTRNKIHDNQTGELITSIEHLFREIHKQGTSFITPKTISLINNSLKHFKMLEEHIHEIIDDDEEDEEGGFISSYEYEHVYEVYLGICNDFYYENNKLEELLAVNEETFETFLSSMTAQNFLVHSIKTTLSDKNSEGSLARLYFTLLNEDFFIGTMTTTKFIEFTNKQKEIGFNKPNCNFKSSNRYSLDNYKNFFIDKILREYFKSNDAFRDDNKLHALYKKYLPKLKSS